MAPLDLHAREQLVHEGMNDGGQEHEVVRARVGQRGVEPDQARQGARGLNDRPLHGTTKGVHALEADNEVQALVEYLRKRPRGVE